MATRRNFTINQQAVVELGLDLDPIDLCIFEYITGFMHSPQCCKEHTPDGTWYWIAHTKIIEDMPILGIKTKMGIIKRVDKLIKAGLLIKRPDCQQLGRTYYAIGDRYDEFINFDISNSCKKDATPVNESLDPSTFVETKGENSVDTRKQKFRGPINESLDDRLVSSIDKETLSKERAKKDELSLSTPIESDISEAETARLMKEQFNDMFQGTSIPKIVKLDKRRFAPVLQRTKEYGRGAVMDVLERVKESAFLNGDNDRGWTADFDWIFKPTNFVKILEGKYGNNKTGSKKQRANMYADQQLAEYIRGALSKEVDDGGPRPF